jgi:NitT/TauT family transport system substrate-binding protein
MRLRLFLAIACLLAFAPARAEVGEIRITRQPGMIYMPLILMQQLQLLEKQASERGNKDLKVSWVTFTSGGISNEALLSGNIDLVTAGATNLLLIWDRTKGEVKGVAGAGGAPMLLLSRNPEVKTLADFSSKDKIAVPTVKVSTQALVLQMAAEQAFGEAGRNKLDPFTVQLGHPDATQALLNPTHEVDSHFSLPPYQNIALRDPKVHVVLNSGDVVGGLLSNAVVFGTRKFVEANPKLIEAFLAALDEADGIIAREPERAAETYLAATNDKLTKDELVGMMKEPGVFFSSTPHGAMKQADQMFKAGLLKTRPQSWKDFFFSAVHGLPGN